MSRIRVIEIMRRGPRGAPGDMDPAEWDALQDEIDAKLDRADVLNEPDMATGATDKPPSQASVKTYVDDRTEGLTEAENDEAAAGGMLLSDGQITHTVFTRDGRPHPAAAQLIADRLDGLGYAPQQEVENDLHAAGGFVFEGGELTFAVWDQNGRPIPEAAQLIADRLGAMGYAARAVENDRQAAGGFLLNNGQVTFTVFGQDGRPVPEAAQLIADALEAIGWSAGGGAVSSVNGQTGAVTLNLSDPTAIDSTWGEYRPHPQVSKPVVGPILAYGAQPAETLYWPSFVDRRAMGGEGVTLIYSTDHAAVHENSGLFTADADSPTDIFSANGRVYRDDEGGTQCETPSVIWDEVEEHYKVYYQMKGIGRGAQSTLLATTPDLVNYTRVGIVAEMADTKDPGDGHTGYFRPFRWANSWFAYSLYGGTARSRFGFWGSLDGVTWIPHPQRLGWQGHMLDHLNGWDNTWLFKWYVGDVILWRGQPWWVGLIGPGSAGGQIVTNRVCVAPMSADLMHLAGRPIDVTPPAQAWEEGGITYVGSAITWNGRTYLPYRGNSATGGFGVLEVA